jgi:uncharacterized membrane protein YukC
VSKETDLLAAEMEKYEEQKHGVSGQKEHQGIARWVVTGLSIALTLLMYYTAFWGTFPPIIQRGGT